MMVRWQRFVTGAEVENSAVTTCVAATAAEHFTAAKPAHENKRFWRWYIEMFAIRFLVLDLNVVAQSLRNGVPWRCYPEAFMVVTFTPSEVAICSHQGSENLGEVARMQHNQPHTVQHSLLYACPAAATTLAMTPLSPPPQHTRRVELVNPKPTSRPIQSP